MCRRERGKGEEEEEKAQEGGGGRGPGGRERERRKSIASTGRPRTGLGRISLFTLSTASVCIESMAGLYAASCMTPSVKKGLTTSRYRVVRVSFICRGPGSAVTTAWEGWDGRTADASY